MTVTHRRRLPPASRPRPFLPALAALLLGVSALAAQVTPDQAADMVLTSARKAYNEKNYPFAVARFREFLAKYGNHKDLPAARYGLALALLESPEKDYPGAIEQLQQLAGNKNLPEYPFFLYYLGLSQRGLGTRELAQAIAKPPEAVQRRAVANQRFEEAAKQFAAADVAFTAKGKAPAADAKELPPDLEWAARARCDLAEMQLRTLKTKEAVATAAPFIKDPVLTKSRYRGLGLYYHGFASFLLQDYLTAGRSLNLLTPFDDPVFGTHARYLLARIHHVADERPEATNHYEGVLADYAKNKLAAVEALKQPDKFKNNPDEKTRLEALVKDPPPDYVARADFQLGVLLYEAGRFADALARFGGFAQLYPGSALLNEAQLRQGFCQVQLKQYADALKTLPPLEAKEPRLADQVIFWVGKAQAGAADPTNPAAYDQALKAAVETFRRAADRANQLAAADPEAKLRRGEMMLEMADTQQYAKQYKEAAATYAQILAEKSLPQRDEEVLQRQATALHMAGDYAGSDQLCARFQQQYPKSSLLPAVLFRSAENAAFVALAAEKNPNLPNRVQELAKLNDEVIKRYQLVVDKYPDFPHTNLARYGLGLAYYRKGELDKAREKLEAIPQAERAGDLALVSYVLADCLLRLTPLKAEDALAAGRIQEQVQAASELLDAFVGGQPTASETPDALIKLGYCHQRLAALLAQPPERVKVLANARAAYEKLMQQFPTHALRPQAVFERAKCLVQSGDVGGGMAELQRFNNELKAAPVAPAALLELATLLRGQNKAAEAAVILGQCRQQQEPTLLQDKARADWVPLLQYHHGVALKEAGKGVEARAVFEQTVRQFPDRPEAGEAGLRWGQSLKEEGHAKIAAAHKALAVPNIKPPEQAAATKMLEEGMKAVRDGVEYLEGRAVQLKDKQPEVRSRMLYDAAWGYRALAAEEVEAARLKVQQEQLKKLQDEAAKKTTPGQTPPVIAPPEVPLAAIPLQPAEQKARAQYQALITTAADLPLAVDARFELAELLADRGEFEPAQKVLAEALDKEPAGDLADKIHLRLGACLAAKGDPKAALAQLEPLAQNPKSQQAGQAHYRAGECLMQTQEWAKAAAHFMVFRDQPPFQNLPGLSDRALLRLGHALGHQNQWDQGRQAQEILVGRFPNSPWVDEARYGIGWAWQNQKQYDNAVNGYAQVTAHTAQEIGAKAQLQIGLCRLEQKRYPEAATALLVVPFTYDYPELSAVALCEAGRTFVELKQPDQAEKLWQRVIKDHPKSKWADVARQRLEALKKG
jgi:TolA-binding protein